MKTYQYSRVFSVLKHTKERITDNWTSAQYSEVLDRLLYESIDPIIRSSNYVDQWIAAILSWYACDARRKISNVGRNKLLTLMMVFITSKDPETKILILRIMRLERNLLSGIVTNWRTFTSDYRRLSDSLFDDKSKKVALYLKQVEVSVLATGSIYGVISTVDFWFNHYTHFKDQLLEKYTRLALIKSKEFYVQTGHVLDLDDIIQIFMVSTSKAIDKYDVQKGSLTSYIQTWFKDARTKCRNMITNTVSLEEMFENANVDIADDSDFVQDICKSQEIERVRVLAKRVDPFGLGRIKLGIEETILF